MYFNTSQYLISWASQTKDLLTFPVTLGIKQSAVNGNYGEYISLPVKFTVVRLIRRVRKNFQ